MTHIRTWTPRGRTPHGDSAADYLVVLWTAALRAAYWIEERLERSRSRRALQELSDHQLKDIGLSRADAFKEGTRRFWD